MGRGVAVGGGVGRGVGEGGGVMTGVGDGVGWCFPGAALTVSVVNGMMQPSVQHALVRTSAATTVIAR